MIQEDVKEPLVSICLPTYNYAHYLPQAISSCLKQSYEHIELIVVDDASTDDSRQVVESFTDPRVRFFENTVRLGLAGNWNKTLSFARGQVIRFLFADDYLAEHAIDRVVEVIRSHENVNLIFSAASIIDAQGIQTRIHQPYSNERYLAGQDELKRCLARGNYIGAPSSVAVRTSALKESGKFDERLKLYADQEMWLRILAGGDAYFIPEPLVSVRQHEGSETNRIVRMGEVDKETLVFLRCVLLNKHICSLLSNSEINNLIERYENTSVEQFSNDVKRRAFLEGGKSFIIGLRNSRTVPYLKKTVLLARKRAMASARFRHQRIRNRNDHLQQKRINSFLNLNKPVGPKLHLGCGDTYFDDYVNIDFPPSEHTVMGNVKPDVYADLKTIAFLPESVAVIRSHHVFEHFDRPSSLAMLIRWYQWMKEDGVIVIETPDFEKAAKRILTKQGTVEE